MIKIEGLAKKWNGFAIDGVNLEIEDGEYFVILGPTGAGKTLLLELIAGFHEPDEGKIYIDGKDVTELPPYERKIGFVYQDYMLFPNMSVYDNIAYGLRINKMDEDEIEEIVKKYARLLGIQPILHREPLRLSGGEQQRVAIARALAIQPKILLLDEPLAALDEMLRQKIMREMKEINRKLGITFIHVTHSREEAMILADRIAVINEGKIIQIGKPEEIFRKPKTTFMAEFVGVENIFKGVAKQKDGLTLFNAGNVEMYAAMPFKGECYASIRPEDIILSESAIKSSARNCIKGEIKKMEDIGKLIRVAVDCNGLQFIVNVTREAASELKLSIGKEIFLIFKAQNVNLFR